jgi:Tfp pilus assembly protein PilO
MKSPLANLTSLERRFVIGVMVVVFIVLNLLFVRPRFADWGKVQSRHANATRKLELYRADIATYTNLQKEVAALEGAGLSVPPEEQAVDFLRTIQNTALQTGVNIQSSQRATTRTNDQFFLEQAQSVTVVANETNLVNFLHQLSANNALISVRDLVMRPDPPRQQLNASLKLVASYQKKSPVKAAPPAAPAAAANRNANKP